MIVITTDSVLPIVSELCHLLAGVLPVCVQVCTLCSSSPSPCEVTADTQSEPGHGHTHSDNKPQVLSPAVLTTTSIVMYDAEDFDQMQTAEFREAFNEFDKVTSSK